MRILVFLLSFLLCSNALAVNNIPISETWEPAGFGGAGTYPQIVPDNTTANRLYLASDVAGNLYSDDAGDNWQFMNVGTTTILNTAIAQSESNPSILYSIGKKLIKSTDGGASWYTLGTYATRRPNTYKCIAINRSNPSIFYFSTTNGKIYRSLNGGTNITEYATPFGTNIPAEFLYINEAGTRLVAGSNGYGMVSYDLTTDTPTDIDFVNTNGLYNNDFGTYDNGGTEVFCVTAGLIIKCTEDFSTWDDTAETTATTTYYIRRMAVKKLSGGSISFLAWSRLISSQYTNFTSLSTDDGASWTNVSVNIVANETENPTNEWANFGTIGTIFSIAFDPHSDTKAWATTDWRIWYSNDGGVNWVEKDKNAQNVVVSDVACSPGTVTRCFQAGMDIGLLYSDDVGEAWNATFPNTANGAQQGFAVAGHIWRVLTRGTQEEWDAGTGQVVATTSNWADFKPRVIISSDNGETWTIVTSGLPTTQLNSSSGSSDPNRAAWGIGYPRGLAKCSANDDILALSIDGYSATENGGIFISTDGGATWARTTQPTQWKVYNAIGFDPTDATCNTIVFSEWFASTGGTSHTYRTTNRGTSWTEVDDDTGAFDLAFATDGKAYKTGLNVNPDVEQSADGITWAIMHAMNTSSQIADGLWTDPQNANRVCVGVNDGANTGTSQGSGSDGIGDGAGSIYCTAEANLGSSAVWYHLTGDLPSPGGVTAITAAYGYNDHDWLLIGTDGAGTFRLKMDDGIRTTITNVRTQ